MAGIRITQLHAQRGTGMAYGSFAGKPEGSGSPHPVAILTQLHAQRGTGMRYGSFAGKPAASPPAGGDMVWWYMPVVIRNSL